MEPPGEQRSATERQSVRCNPFITIEVLPNPSIEKQTLTQHQTYNRLLHCANDSQAFISPQAIAQPSAQMKNNMVMFERIPAMASTATVVNATTQAATVFSGSSLGHHHPPHHQHMHHQHAMGSVATASLQNPNHSGDTAFLTVSGVSQLTQQQTIEKLSRPMAFDKMEVLVREMQDQEHGVPVRQQKMFLTSIPYAFMGYDLIEWLMDHLQIEESEALNIANQLCLHGYFFPVNDSKTLTVKDDSSLYRFQTPYYWPWQHKAPDNVEYAIYLAKRSLRNKQRHALEDYEAEAFASLHKNLKGKWEFISMQAEEQVRLAKERKKGDKIVSDSQERAYWRVHRPPPGHFTPLEPCPVPSRDRQGQKPYKKKTVDDIQREVKFLSKTLNRTRMKMSQACESLVCYSETFSEYDFFLQPPLPSNPWVTDDIAFWQLNSSFVDVPTEKRVKRWAISVEELLSDPTGLLEFTTFLEKEYSHENIRFWIAVNRLRRSAHSHVAGKVKEIFEEFLKPGAPCEINIDGKTMESVLCGLKSPSRFTFDSASEHIYMLLLKKDCYPRFIRSEHYKRLLDSGIQPSHKKRFFNFGAVSGAKKKMTAALSSQTNLGELSKFTSTANTACVNYPITNAPDPCNLARRRGSDRSLTGSALELAVITVNKKTGSKVAHSHSQNNLCELPYRESPNTKFVQLETTVEISPSAGSSVCPWDEQTTILRPDDALFSPNSQNKVILPLSSRLNDVKFEKLSKPLESNLEICEVAGRIQRNLCIRHQHTVDNTETSIKIVTPNQTEQRRASVSLIHRSNLEFQHNISTLPIVHGNLQSLKADVISDSFSNAIPKDLVAVNDQKGKYVSHYNITPESYNIPPPSVLPEVSKQSSPMTMHINKLGNKSSPNLPIVRACTTETDVVIKEVQIELIEPSIYNKSKMQLEIDAGTTFHNIQKVVGTANKPFLKSKEDLQSQSEIKIMNEMKKTIESNIQLHVQESAETELSPTTDEYQEGLHFSDASTDVVFNYNFENTKGHFGYIAPVSTPAPSIAPLAVLEIDIADDEPIDDPELINDDIIRQNKKRNSGIKKFSSLDEKDKKLNEKATCLSKTGTDDAVHNTICPWEDETITSSDGTFVKTYATLGYL